jgi:hypothetical protein
MLVSAPKMALLLFTLAGCRHSSPDVAVLAALVPHLAPSVSDQSKEPENLVFADELTATVFKSLRRDAHFRILPNSARLVCPSPAAEGLQGYALRARVNQTMGDTAIATVERICSRAGGPLSTGEIYLLVRRNGRWRMERILNGFSMVGL